MATLAPWPGARSARTLSSRGSGGQAGPRLRFQVRRREAGGGQGYLLQSLCSMLYTSSSWLRPSKKGMRSSSSVSVMSSNQDCTGTWKTVRAAGSQPDCAPTLQCLLWLGGWVSSHHQHHHLFVLPSQLINLNLSGSGDGSGRQR